MEELESLGDALQQSAGASAFHSPPFLAGMVLML